MRKCTSSGYDVHGKFEEPERNTTTAEGTNQLLVYECPPNFPFMHQYVQLN